MRSSKPGTRNQKLERIARNGAPRATGTRNQKPRIILASASPRRRKLLRELGLKFRVTPVNVRERVWKNLSARRTAERNAVLKAQAAARKCNGLIIAADTIVASRFGIVGKPRSKRDAVRILSRLSGTRHRVITGLCLLDTASCRGARRAPRKAKMLVGSEVTYVKMHKMTPDEIQAYVDSGEAMGKAGAYAIQETGDRYVEKVEGSLTNVVGLPMELLTRMLRQFGVPV